MQNEAPIIRNGAVEGTFELLTSDGFRRNKEIKHRLGESRRKVSEWKVEKSISVTAAVIKILKRPTRALAVRRMSHHLHSPDSHSPHSYLRKTKIKLSK